MTAADWPTPAAPTEQVPLTWGKYLLVFIGVFAFALVVALANFGPADEAEPTGGGDLHTLAGWTPATAVDILVDLKRDAGWSEARADCAMRSVVGSVTYMEWRALTRGGQLSLIRQSGC